jgi:hypothetical protein
VLTREAVQDLAGDEVLDTLLEQSRDAKCGA